MNMSVQTCDIALNAVGAGFKPAHGAEILATRPDIGFFEIHAENHMNPGGPNRRLLAAIREFFPISVHGVGLSLGSTEKLDSDHLARLKDVVDFAAPALVSEHIAWSDFSGRAFPDLLPLPYDDAALARIAGKIEAVQDALRRPILIENPATYLRFAGDFWPNRNFWPSFARGPAVACCSTSTMFSSARSIIALTRATISTPFLTLGSAKSISPAMRKRATKTGPS